MQHRNFQLFIAGQLISLIGTWMQTTAQLWLVYKLTGSAALLGVFGFANQVPILFLGKPLDENDPYFHDFKGLVDQRWVRYPGFVSREEKHRSIRQARGFALLSQFESGCIALYEAAAAGLPLLLPELPWATRVYQHARDKEFLPLQSAERLAPADLYAQSIVCEP